MTNYNNEYSQKLTTPEKAVKVIKSGDWVDYTHGLSVPLVLDSALAKRGEELEDIKIRGYLVLHPLEIYKSNDLNNRIIFTFNSWHFGGIERRLREKGYAFFNPMRYSELPKMYRNDSDINRVDVAMLRTTSMDRFGYFNLGPSNSNTREVLNRAKHIIIEVNPNIPYVQGMFDENVHISEVDAIVEANDLCETISNAQPTSVDIKIANQVVDLIPNEATLQLGIGAIPDAIGSAIAKSNLKDLGIHSEMYVDSMMTMTKAGVITGKKKSLNRGKQVFTFGAGSKELYEYMNHNPELITAPVDYVNNPKIVAEHKKFISINSAIEIDLFGQVNAESIGYKQISGTGGQLDFVIGAYHSEGGKSIIAIPSTYKDKDSSVNSRIVSNFLSGTVITDPRTTTQYIVTEYGVFNCKGKSLWERAEGLINISHPDFREKLIDEANKMGVWRKTNK